MNQAEWQKPVIPELWKYEGHELQIQAQSGEFSEHLSENKNKERDRGIDHYDTVMKQKYRDSKIEKGREMKKERQRN